ncbi:MAG TPA: DUF5916 domain-containing protein [Thermoanaerobaculia bacterium]|nr:DUF5916 domain-containing protein [Thermoanaerobaculia bacterium]
MTNLRAIRSCSIQPLLWLVSAAAAAGQEPAPAAAGAPRRLEALAIDRAIDVDGSLDDEPWSRAVVASGFTQHDPHDGVPATEDTELQAVYTPSTLYLAIFAHDAKPQAIIAKEMERDSPLERDDSVIVVLDTFRDRRNAYAFATNANAARFDVLVTDEGRNLNPQWNGVWAAAARRTASGWVAEIAIPFATLRFDPSLESWGFNVQRSIRHLNETGHFAALPRDVGISPNLQIQPVYRVSLAGELAGLRGLRTSRRLDLKPYVLGSAGERDESLAPPGAPDLDDFEPGLDVKWGVTRELALDVTLNTDFAEVEVDDQQVNLTRFSLFFPEKREFFLENSGIFDFGPPLRRDEDPALLEGFFSRRIGLDAGQEVPIDAGVRLTGRPGAWNLGVLAVATREVSEPGRFVPDTAFGVVRVKRNLGQRSSVGALFTGRDPSGPGRNQVLGADFDYRPSRKLSLTGFAAQSDDEAVRADAGDEHTAGLGFGYEGRALIASLDLLEVGEDFRPETGFLLRSDIRRVNPRVRYTPRTPQLERYGVRGWYTEALVDYYERASTGELESRRVELTALGMRTTRDERWRLAWIDETENLFAPFVIFPGVVVPPSLYRFDGWDLGFRSNNRRVVSTRTGVVWGDFFTGERFSVRSAIIARPSRFVRTSTGWVHNDVELREGAFTTNVLSQRVDFSFTPDMRLNALVQYNDAVDFLGANLRFNWSYRPGADLYVVYNETWDAPSLSDRATRDRQIIVKVTYLIRR